MSFKTFVFRTRSQLQQLLGRQPTIETNTTKFRSHGYHYRNQTQPTHYPNGQPTRFPDACLSLSRQSYPQPSNLSHPGPQVRYPYKPYPHQDNFPKMMQSHNPYYYNASFSSAAVPGYKPSSVNMPLFQDMCIQNSVPAATAPGRQPTIETGQYGVNQRQVLDQPSDQQRLGFTGTTAPSATNSRRDPVSTSVDIFPYTTTKCRCCELHPFGMLKLCTL